MPAAPRAPKCGTSTDDHRCAPYHHRSHANSSASVIPLPRPKPPHTPGTRDLSCQSRTAGGEGGEGGTKVGDKLSASPIACSAVYAGTKSSPTQQAASASSPSSHLTAQTSTEALNPQSTQHFHHETSPARQHHTHAHDLPTSASLRLVSGPVPDDTSSSSGTIDQMVVETKKKKDEAVLQQHPQPPVPPPPPPCPGPPPDKPLPPIPKT